MQDSKQALISREKPHISPQGGTQSGTPADPNLIRLADRWPELDDDIRRAILTLAGIG